MAAEAKRDWWWVVEMESDGAWVEVASAGTEAAREIGAAPHAVAAVRQAVRLGGNGRYRAYRSSAIVTFPEMTFHPTRVDVGKPGKLVAA